MAQQKHTPPLQSLEESITVLFCLVDDAYARLNPHGERYGTLKKLSDSEILTLAIFQQLRGVESERSFLRDIRRFFACLFPGVAGLAPSSFNRRVRKLRRFLESLRREILPELIGEPETLIVDSTLLEVLHPRQVSQSAGWGSVSSGGAWVRWGTFSVYGVKLHLLCSANRVPLSYELTPANVADVRLTEELIAEAGLGDAAARRLLGDLAYSSEDLREALAECGILLATEPSERRREVRQHIEIAFSSLKRVFGLGETLVVTLMGLATRIAAKICLHLWLLRQPDIGSSSRPDQGGVGIKPRNTHLASGEDPVCKALVRYPSYIGCGGQKRSSLHITVERNAQPGES